MKQLCRKSRLVGHVKVKPTRFLFLISQRGSRSMSFITHTVGQDKRAVVCVDVRANA